nr:alpha,alpha-trehalase TreF [Pedobacter sp. ASV19]
MHQNSPHSPSLFVEELEELFTVVQMSAVFPDQKTFPDCIPKRPVTEILSEYRTQYHTLGFDLKAFVAENFLAPKTEASHFKSEVSKGIEYHIHSLWDVLTRTAADHHGSLLALPEKFVVPGGRFRECFYWDSYFTMLGLQVSKRIDLIESMIENFAYLIDQFGFIPNGNRTYFLSRSQPPFFSHMIELLSEEKGNAVYQHYLPQLLKEYAFWMAGENHLNLQNHTEQHLVMMPNGDLLNRYYDQLNKPRPESYLEDTETMRQGEKNICLHIRAACESGWDFSSRWFKDHQNLETAYTTDIIPVDLNSLLWHLEKTIEKAERMNGNVGNADIFHKKATCRAQSIRKYLWSDSIQTYFDYLRSAERQTNFHSIAIAYPLFVGISNQEEADAIAEKLERNFLKEGGLLTTLNSSGQQWDAPNGWAPLQWVAYKGLLNYGHHDLAEKIRSRWTGLIEKHFADTGKISEKYNVENIDLTATGGEYPNQDGFGWTNGVYLKMKHQH